MHQVAVAVHDIAFGAEDGLFAFWTTATGEGCVVGGYADHLDTIWNSAMSYQDISCWSSCSEWITYSR
jgi:hypothetical protein